MPPPTPKCDFCSGFPVTHVLPVESFVLGPAGSKGDWAACPDCARFILRKDWKGLTTRAINSFQERNGRELNPLERESIQLVHSRMRLHIKGALQKYSPGLT